MPYIQINHANYYYEEHGKGSETIVFSHGLLLSGHMYRNQVAYFSKRYRVITYDHRGQGRTEGTETGYDMDTLTDDIALLIQSLSPDKAVIFAGLSMGGFVGMRLTARHPDLVKKLILMNTSCDSEPEENKPKYNQLNFFVKLFGMWSVVSKVMPIMFGKKFLEDDSRKAEQKYWANQMKVCQKKYITKSIEGVINRSGISDELHKIVCPTIIIAGEQDVATVPEKSRKIQSLIAGSKMIIMPGVGHMSVIEEPELTNKEIEKFIKTRNIIQ